MTSEGLVSGNDLYFPQFGFETVMQYNQILVWHLEMGTRLFHILTANIHKGLRPVKYRIITYW